MNINNDRVIHSCSVCGKQGVWDTNWSWKYLIPNRGDNYSRHEEIIKVCSEECKINFQKIKREVS